MPCHKANMYVRRHIYIHKPEVSCHKVNVFDSRNIYLHTSDGAMSQGQCVCLETHTYILIMVLYHNANVYDRSDRNLYTNDGSMSEGQCVCQYKQIATYKSWCHVTTSMHLTYILRKTIWRIEMLIVQGHSSSSSKV